MHNLMRNDLRRIVVFENLVLSFFGGGKQLHSQNSIVAEVCDVFCLKLTTN